MSSTEAPRTLPLLPRVLAREEWTEREAAHQERVDAATATHRERRQSGRAHPVEDFLFTYYPFKPAQLRRWHPGPGVLLADAEDLPRAGWRHYREAAGGVELDRTAYLRARGDLLDRVHRLVSATAARPAQLGCFGLHEWAMVYRLEEDEVRHRGWPLRLGGAGTDAVVESLQLRCTHYDAYRFYTPPARSLNLLQPTRERQESLEQPGCLHAGMDLYKWAMKLAPAVPSNLTMDCFDLAREIRVLDMRASPYDLRALGYAPLPIETATGRAEYAARQRAFAERGQLLRTRLLAALDAVRGSVDVAVG
ncbi:3-methyladenine DNA glycosylase [Pedococcus sp.]|uniref:3-methyladenine DNA glycosylase n=1 Tax=Pedococcus sp. TaxID=2860345 RepID=UPI002E151224|nr:3-methyladenine DNA glycosylase [Pedococcus sp.]